jgi:hypothetical protein
MILWENQVLLIFFALFPITYPQEKLAPWFTIEIAKIVEQLVGKKYKSFDPELLFGL